MTTASLTGRIALVTGSAQGIGLAIATRLAQAGARIVLHDVASPEQAAPALDAAPIVDMPPERWDAILVINLSSAFHTMRLALPC